MNNDAYAARTAELAKAMAQAAARLPCDWPKELPPAIPAGGTDTSTGG